MSNNLNNSKDSINSDFNNSFFKSLAENVPHILFLVHPESFQIQYINKLLPGFKLENILGLNMFSLVDPEHIEFYKQKIKEVLKTGNPSEIQVIRASTIQPTGKSWYRTQISILRGAENTISSLMFLTEDITVYKLQEFENINKSERIKAIINNTTDIICSIDKEFNLLEFNSVFANLVKVGYSIDMQPGMSVLKFTDPKQHDHLKIIYKKVLDGEIYTDVQSFETINGNIVYNETSYNPIYNVNKEISGINIFSKDITQRVKNEQKVKSALKEKEALLAEIHHRIKNNLAMVSSLLQLQEINTNNAEVKEALGLSRKRIKSTALIHELLYRSESFQNIGLRDYLTELFEHLKMNEHIELSLKGDQITLNLITAMPLGLMLNEIMLNSFKHSYTKHSKGQIEIIMTNENDALTINYNDFEGNFPDLIDFKNSITTGLTLIHTFAEQLEGSVELVSKVPPRYKIQIPLNDGH